MFHDFLNTSIIKKAILQAKVHVDLVNIRDFAANKWQRVDTPPIGGGAGMIIQIPPLVAALESIAVGHKVLLSPRGETFSPKKAVQLSQKEHLVLICGHYEGVDDRLTHYLDEEISLGDYILTGGELGAMVISDAVIRLVDDVINEDSLTEESFDRSLLEYPQYTEPFDFRGHKVPQILYSGNHNAIRKWRLKESLRLTKERRPDLYAKVLTDRETDALVQEIENDEIGEWEQDAIKKGEKFTKNKK